MRTSIFNKFSALFIVFAMIFIFSSCSQEETTDSVLPPPNTGLPITFSVSLKQDSSDSATRAMRSSVNDNSGISVTDFGSFDDAACTRAGNVTLIGKSNFNSVVKQIKVSAFKSDGTIFMNAITFNNDGNGNLTPANGSDTYYWPSDGTKLTFVAWYGDKISVDGNGNVSIADGVPTQDNIYCKTSPIGKSNVNGGKVSLNLNHAYAVLTFGSGTNFTLSTISVNGTTYNASDGFAFIKSGNITPWTTSAPNDGDSGGDVPLPSNTSSYFHVTGHFKDDRIDKEMDSYFPVPSALFTVQSGKKYQLSFDESKKWFGYKSDGTPYWFPGVPVDLGLSVKWADCNLGARKSTDYGIHVRWAETKTLSNYTYDNYKYNYKGRVNDYSKYSSHDGKTVLEPADDAASVNWGGSWRTPTKEECKELVNNCSWTEETLNGVHGIRIKGKNGNSIFIPAATFNFYDLSSQRYQWEGENGKYLYYFSSTIEPSDGGRFGFDGYLCAYVLAMDFNGNFEWSDLWVTYDYLNDVFYSYRFARFPIRPVCP